MGIIDDLAMGLGFKARTEDYDARTARTIARNEGVNVGQSRAAQQYLGSRGYDEGYRPQVAQDDRPFMRRLFTSPESQYSPTPYAFGPVRMNQAMSPLGPMGLLMRMMGGGSTKPTAEDIAFIRSIPQREIGGGLSGGGQGERVEPALPTVTPKDYSVYRDIDYPMYVPAGTVPSMTFPMLDEYNVPSSAPLPTSSTMTEPYINFAQYVDAYRKKEAPLLKSGRLKQGKSLQDLQRSYNEQFGVK